MKNDKFKLIFNHLRNCSSQSEKNGQPKERTEIFSLEKTINGYPRREKKSGLGLTWKVSTVDVRIKKSGLKFIHSKVPSSVRSSLFSVYWILTNKATDLSHEYLFIFDFVYLCRISLRISFSSASIFLSFLDIDLVRSSNFKQYS